MGSILRPQEQPNMPTGWVASVLYFERVDWPLLCGVSEP